jgi:hypothetical protein
MTGILNTNPARKTTNISINAAPQEAEGTVQFAKMFASIAQE